MQRVMMAVAHSGGALEIKSHHMRLDLRDTHARLAVEAGVPLCIDTDAHDIADFDKLPLGIATARRAWPTGYPALSPARILSFRYCFRPPKTATRARFPNR